MKIQLADRPNPRTPGKDLESHLNANYGPGNAFYEDFCTLVKKGIEEGWAASGELDGPKYRRGRVRFPPHPIPTLLER